MSPRVKTPKPKALAFLVLSGKGPNDAQLCETLDEAKDLATRLAAGHNRDVWVLKTCLKVSPTRKVTVRTIG